MNNKSELQKLIKLLNHIQDSYAARVKEGVFWNCRNWVIKLIESGRTIYSTTVPIDSFTLEADCKAIRERLEQMIKECELPILHKEVA